MHVWMEYCNGGDLRKVSLQRLLLSFINFISLPLSLSPLYQGVMTDPQNCCGLPEKQIREILRDIS